DGSWTARRAGRRRGRPALRGFPVVGSPAWRAGGSGFEHLAALALGPVLPAGRAGGVLQVRLAAGRVDADDGGDDCRLPLCTARPGVAARHLPLRNGHDLLLVVA